MNAFCEVVIVEQNVSWSQTGIFSFARGMKGGSGSVRLSLYKTNPQSADATSKKFGCGPALTFLDDYLMLVCIIAFSYQCLEGGLLQQ